MVKTGVRYNNGKREYRVLVDDGEEFHPDPRDELKCKQRLQYIGDLIGRVGTADVIISTPFLGGVGFLAEKLTGQELMSNTYSIASGKDTLKIDRLDDRVDPFEWAFVKESNAPGTLNDYVVISHIDPFGGPPHYEVAEGVDLKDLFSKGAEFPLGPQVELPNGDHAPTGRPIASGPYGEPGAFSVRAKKITDYATGDERKNDIVTINTWDSVSIRGEIPCIDVPGEKEKLPLDVVIGSIGVGPHISPMGYRALSGVHGKSPLLNILVNTAGAVSKENKVNLYDTCIVSRRIAQNYNMQGQFGIAKKGQSPYQSEEFPTHSSLGVNEDALEFFRDVNVEGLKVKETAVFSHYRLADPLEKLAISLTDLGPNLTRKRWNRQWQTAYQDSLDGRIGELDMEGSLPENKSQRKNLISKLQTEYSDKAGRDKAWAVNLGAQQLPKSRRSREVVGLVDQESFYFPSAEPTIFLTCSNTYNGGGGQWLKAVGYGFRAVSDFTYSAIKEFGQKRVLKGEVYNAIKAGAVKEKVYK